MKAINLLFLMLSIPNFAQVGIGTTNPDSSAILQLESTTQAFIPPRMTNEQMLNITNPLHGSVVYNTSYEALYIRKSTGWETTNNTTSATVVLNRVGGSISTVNNNYYDFPLGTSNILSDSPEVFEVQGNGSIKVHVGGVYYLTAGFSSTNLPAGNHKYIIGVYKNGSLIGYLVRGIASQDITDYWGTSGTLVYTAETDDIFTFKYVLNNNGTAVNAAFFNMSITKMK